MKRATQKIKANLERKKQRKEGRKRKLIIKIKYGLDNCAAEAGGFSTILFLKRNRQASKHSPCRDPLKDSF